MTERELKKLSRADLLEMLIDQSKELQRTQRRLHKAEEELEERRIAINEAGSIAEAALRLNGIFEAAQASCEQYMENIQFLSSRQEEICKWREEESMRKCTAMLEETQKRCAALEAETEERCFQILAKAKADSRVYWDEAYQKLESSYGKHAAVRELLNSSPMMDR